MIYPIRLYPACASGFAADRRANQAAGQCQPAIDGVMILKSYLSSDPGTQISSANITTISKPDVIPRHFTDYTLMVDATRNVYDVTVIIPQYFHYECEL